MKLAPSDTPDSMETLKTNRNSPAIQLNQSWGYNIKFWIKLFTYAEFCKWKSAKNGKKQEVEIWTKSNQMVPLPFHCHIIWESNMTFIGHNNSKSMIQDTGVNSDSNFISSIYFFPVFPVTVSADTSLKIFATAEL